ncbi:MAG: hypothetical protein ABI323_05980 [Solirubrobacteraceae bacterium]
MIASAARMTGARVAVRAMLVPGAALAVHQLRYRLAFGSGAGAELARQGHSYLHSLVPWIVLLIALATGAFLHGLGRALVGQRSAPRFTLSLAALWLISTACLIGIYMAQELLEGLWATGHPAGLAGVFGYGGWWAIPVAACVGLVLAAVFHGARWVLDEVAERWGRAPAARATRPRTARPPQVVWLPRLLSLADGWSPRGPPR